MVYLDHAASTPMLPEAVDAVVAELRRFGNASSLHAPGRAARRVVEESRERIAAALGSRPSEVVFTAGGTESDNLAIKGLFWQRRDADPRRRRVLASGVEHHAVLDAVLWLAEHEGAEITWLPVDAVGRVEPSALGEALADPNDVALISVMWANNEIGTVQPITQLAELGAAHGIPFHTDAVQAVGQIPADLATAGVDALTLAGHKLGGPLGSGALLLSRELSPVPLSHGGGQERDVRSGTVDVPSIAGLAVAVELAVKRQAEEAERVSGLRDDLVRRLREAVPEAQLNGDTNTALDHRLPGNAHFSFPGCEGDSLLLLLDARDIACSTGSACSAGVARPSHVLLAMGHNEEQARSSLRFTLGHTSTAADVDALIEALPPVVERARRS